MKRVFLTLLILLFASPVWAADIVTKVYDHEDATERVIRWEITSHTDGVAYDEDAAATSVTGMIYFVSVTPADDADPAEVTAVDNIPSDNFNVEMRRTVTAIDASDDEIGIQVFADEVTCDVFHDLTATCDNATATEGMPVDPINGGIVYLKDRSITPYCSGMGDTKRCLIEVIIRKTRKL